MASYYKRKNGTYCVRVSNGLIGGRQQLVSATYRPMPGMSKAAVMSDLREFSRKFEKAVHDGVYAPGMRRQIIDPFFTEMPLERFIREIYDRIIEEKLSPNTVKFYRKVCEQFLIPSFGHLRLCDITHHNLQAFIHYLAYQTERRDGKEEKGLSPATVKRYATVFQSIMTEACRSGYLDENPLRHDSIVYPKIPVSKLNVYTPDEVEAFCQALQGEPTMTRLLLLTPILLGLRHTCGSLMMALGADAGTVRDVLGHDSVRTTDIYLHPYDGNKKRAATLVGSVIEEVYRETEDNTGICQKDA